MIKSKRNVLFLCTGNSARSQMAEALLKAKAKDQFNVYSAGTYPEEIDSRAIDALNKFGINTSNIESKNISEFTGKTFDFVISLCDKAGFECMDFPNANKQLFWDFSDPKKRSGNMPFIVTLNEINNRISMFLLIEGLNSNKRNTTNNVNVLKLDVIAFYKNFTDEIRLKVLMLSQYHGELCVCELMAALAEDSQPKVSRNLAILRKSNIITARKHGQWVFYRINPELPLWAKSIISQTTENNIELIKLPLQRLAKMKNRPNKTNFCK